MTEEKSYPLVICPICKAEDFKNSDYKSAMIVTNGLYNYLTKFGYTKAKIGVFVCLSRFDPVVNPEYDLGYHIFEINNH